MLNATPGDMDVCNALDSRVSLKDSWLDMLNDVTITSFMQSLSHI